MGFRTEGEEEEHAALDRIVERINVMELMGRPKDSDKEAKARILKEAVKSTDWGLRTASVVTNCPRKGMGTLEDHYGRRRLSKKLTRINFSLVRYGMEDTPRVSTGKAKGSKNAMDREEHRPGIDDLTATKKIDGWKHDRSPKIRRTSPKKLRTWKEKRWWGEKLKSKV